MRYVSETFILIGILSCVYISSVCADKKIFEISSYDDYHNDEGENEIIKAAFFFNPQVLKRDNNKYKPLHSYVKQYNQQITKAKIQMPDIFHHSQLYKRKILNQFPKVKPYKDLKSRLKKITEEGLNFLKKKRNVLNYDKLDYYNILENRVNFIEMKENWENTKLNSYEEDSLPLLGVNIEEIKRYMQLSSTIDTKFTLESTDETIYDYNSLKMNYEQQVEQDKNINDTLDHKKKQMVEVPDEKIMDFNKTANCTKKDLDYFNIKAIKCLLRNYHYVKNTPEGRKILSNIWLIIKIWLCIYICIAIPCWCQRGWCCCCFRCKICFPRKRILFAKHYYMKNPPGILRLSKKKPVKYEPSEFEQDIYEEFESAIRNI